MSILIKGVEKPKDCRHCRFLSKTSISSDCKFLTVDYYCDVLVKWKGETDCPLIELPPHGDLIDRDVLTSVTEMVNGEFKTYYEKFEIDDAPTIIEAEETDMDSSIRIFEEYGEEDGMDSFIRILKD